MFNLYSQVLMTTFPLYELTRLQFEKMEVIKVSVLRRQLQRLYIFEFEWIWKKCEFSTGVAIGAGWQSIVAYVNIGCYYIIGIPVGIVLGNVINWQVKVSYNYITLVLKLHLYAALLLNNLFNLCREYGWECCLEHWFKL